MRVLMLSKACIVGIYQRKLELIARRGVELMTVVPPGWRDERGEQLLEWVYTDGYQLQVTPIRFNGSFHLHHYPALGQLMRQFAPDIVHIDEEPYNVASWQALYHARKQGARSLFFTWQNINRQYPPPFRWGEKWVLNNVDYAIAGTQSAADVSRAKGYCGGLDVIPQFGTDPELFTPQPRPQRPFTVGYIGRLVPEKGIADLMRAFASLPDDARLRVVGGGPERESLAALANTLQIADRVEFVGQVASTDMPAQYAALDVLVLPSHTRPNWKEQFGRVLVEAMASGVNVIGSDSGAIPDVIGDAGLIFPEGDIAALGARLRQIMTDDALAATLQDAGRQRVLTHFSHEQVADATLAVYERLIDGSYR